jgi:hypothetical protein
MYEEKELRKRGKYILRKEEKKRKRREGGGVGVVTHPSCNRNSAARSFEEEVAAAPE